MLFFSFFKTLVNHEVTVELKNDISIRGTLKSVDQYLNIKLDDISVVEEMKYPHLSSVKNVFIRGSVVRYVHLPAAAVDTPLLEDATRRGRGEGEARLRRATCARQNKANSTWQHDQTHEQERDVALRRHEIVRG
ncbi:U6 snRNA-associated Sm-like protein LSm2 [Friedmanniomyces endolithicus]|nr:U6 snRNA-associated Sm-like protein LSm2 [Friedmanniomyces endolithicus]